MGKAPDSPRILGVGLSPEEACRVTAGLGAPVEVLEPGPAAAALASGDRDLVVVNLASAAEVLRGAAHGPMALGPQFLVLYPPEAVVEAERLARAGRVHLVARAGDYLAWLAQFAAQALAAGRALREAVGQFRADRHRLESAVESMSEGLLVVDRDYRTAVVNPVARALLGVDSLEALAVKLRAGEVDPGLHPVFWLEAHDVHAKPLRCWETLGCGREDCPAYGCGLFPCWLYDGTLCQGGEPGRFPDKLADCYECVVYRSGAPLGEPSRARGRREVVTERPPERILESVSSPIVDEGGRFLGAVKLLRDVTLERKLEQVRAQFVEFITHELRTPLTSISGFLWLVLGGHSGGLTETQSRQLTIAHGQCKRLMGLVDDLLDLSAIETGHLRLSPQPFDLVPLLAETIEALRPQADARQVSLRVAPIEGPLMVQADRARIAQVLTNLAANAIKYTEPGGPVTLSARQDAEGTRVEVADAGQGIAPDEAPRLFDRYYRAETVGLSVSGFGLGLAICKGIIDAHRGRIWVESTEGQGARFAFTIPPPAQRPDAHDRVGGSP